MSARTTRTARTRLFAATAVAFAALSLTACQSGDDTSGAGTSSPSVTADGTGQGGQASKASNTGGSGTGGSGTVSSGSTDSDGSPGTGGPNGGGSGVGKGSRAGQSSTPPGKCGAKSLRVKAAEVTRPLNHMLLTVTNTGSKTCVLPPYPMARFGEAQAVPPVAEGTRPQAPTQVAPDESAYAGARLSAGDGSAGGGHTVHSLTIPFDDGSIATVPLPAKGVYVDDSLLLTYWQPGLDTALDF